MMNNPVRSVVIAVTVAFAMCAVSMADTAKPAANSNDNKAGVAAIKEATTALVTQFQAYEKDQAANPIETTSDYFKKNPNTDITQQQIVNALQSSYGNDTFTDCYVKWQLLSGVVGKFDDSVAKQALMIYQRATSLPLVPDPGMNHAALSQELARLGSRAKANLEEVNTQLKNASTATETQNHTILAYRNQLFVLLPPSPDVFSAAMQDALNRMQRGISGDSIMTPARTAITEWSVDATPQQAIIVANNLNRLVSVGTAKSVTLPYSQMVVDAKTSVASWQSRGLLDGEGITKVADKLKQDASNPQQQLGFKKDSGN